MGFGELIVILFLVLLFFGAGKLPALGDGLGKALRGIKEGMKPAPPAKPAERGDPGGDPPPRA